jgi:hypothetical protein
VDTRRVFAEQQRRQRAISAHCSVRPSSEDDLTVMQLRNIYVLDDYQTLYCKVPKVMCICFVISERCLKLFEIGAVFWRLAVEY